jgi:TPR repeat protein
MDEVYIMNKLILRVTLVSTLITVMSACSSYKNDKSHVIYTNASSYLSNEQIAEFTRKAQLGDGEAAFALARFYGEIKQDQTKEIEWMALAATNGVVAAQYNMGMAYDGEIHPDLTDIEKAKYWFKRAACQGDNNAKRKLEELGQVGPESNNRTVK